MSLAHRALRKVNTGLLAARIFSGVYLRSSSALHTVLLKIIQTKIESGMDQIANIRWIMETAREFQKPLYMGFIDYSKTFDCVDHNHFWSTLIKMGVPHHHVTLNEGLVHQPGSCRVFRFQKYPKVICRYKRE